MSINMNNVDKTNTCRLNMKVSNRNIIIVFQYHRAVLTTRDASIITIFPAGNDIDLKHRLMIIIFNIFSSFNKLT